MKSKKGFTLVELLAVIVLLGIVTAVSVVVIIQRLNTAKIMSKYNTAKDIVDIASAYIGSTTNNDENTCVYIKILMDEGMVDSDATNPRTGDNTWDFKGLDKYAKVCYIKGTLGGKRAKDNNYKPVQGAESATDNSWAYYFDHYFYSYLTSTSITGCVPSDKYQLINGTVCCPNSNVGTDSNGNKICNK